MWPIEEPPTPIPGLPAAIKPEPKLDPQAIALKIEEQRQQFQAAQRKLLEHAAAQFQRLAEHYPMDARIYYSLGLAALAAGDDNAAFRYMRTAYTIDPATNADTLAKLGKLYIQNEQYSEAAALLLKAREMWPSEECVLDRLATAYHWLRDAPREIEVLRKLATIGPDASGASYRLAKIMSDTGDRDAAIGMLKEINVRDPNNVKSRYLLGKLLYRTNKMSDARHTLLEGLNIDPRHGGILYTLGQVWRSLGNPLRAARYYAAATKVDSSHSMTFAQAAFAFAAAGHYEEEERMIRLRLQHHPSDPHAIIAMASLLYEQHTDEEASKLLNNAIAGATDSSPFRIEIAHLMWDYGHKKEGLTVLEAEMQSLEPERAIMAGIAMVSLLKEDRKVAEALKIAADMHAEYPADPRMMRQLASLYLSANRLDDFDALNLELDLSDFLHRYLKAKRLYLGGDVATAHEIIRPSVEGVMTDRIRTSTLGLYLVTASESTEAEVNRIRAVSSRLVETAFQQADNLYVQGGSGALHYREQYLAHKGQERVPGTRFLGRQGRHYPGDLGDIEFFKPERVQAAPHP